MIVSLVLSSFLFYNQIGKMKQQIDAIYFGNLVPVVQLQKIVNAYDKILLANKIVPKEKKLIRKNWKQYYKSYKTIKEKDTLKKIDDMVILSLLKYNENLLKKVIFNLGKVIDYEAKMAYQQRQIFLQDYEQMQSYLKYNLGALLFFTLVILAFVIYLSMQKHTELEKLTHKYKMDSITDGLTNLYNRKHFDMVFSKVALISNENGWKSAFIMLDIDFFKQYNDTYGHDMGDLVLKNVANTLRRSFNKEYEYVFRLGGEEFGIIIFDTAEVKLKKSLDNFQHNLASLQIPHSASETGILTASMGVVMVDGTFVDRESKELYKEADDKLYVSKENGRNRYTI
jgi:diguanylate cyclase (GGDEF)-like protein